MYQCSYRLDQRVILKPAEMDSSSRNLLFLTIIFDTNQTFMRLNICNVGQKFRITRILLNVFEVSYAYQGCIYLIKIQ